MCLYMCACVCVSVSLHNCRIYGVSGQTAFEHRFLPTTFPKDSIVKEVSCEAVNGEPNLLSKFIRLMLFAAICTLPAAFILIFSVWFIFSSFFFLRDLLLGSRSSPRASQAKKTKEE